MWHFSHQTSFQPSRGFCVASWAKEIFCYSTSDGHWEIICTLLYCQYPVLIIHTCLHSKKKEVSNCMNAKSARRASLCLTCNNLFSLVAVLQYCCFFFFLLSFSLKCQQESRQESFANSLAHTLSVFTCRQCRKISPRLFPASLLQSSQARQRKESLQESMDKAKEGRQDTVRLLCWNRRYIYDKSQWSLWQRVCARAEGEGQFAEGVGGSEEREDSPAGWAGQVQGVWPRSRRGDKWVKMFHFIILLAHKMSETLCTLLVTCSW